MAAIKVTDKSFVQEVLYPRMAVLLDVYTPNCGPCRSLAPIIDKLAKELVHKVKIVKLDASEHAQLAESLQVRAVPSLIAFREGVEVARKTGFQPEPRLRSWIEELVEGDIVREKSEEKSPSVPKEIVE